MHMATPRETTTWAYEFEQRGCLQPQRCPAGRCSYREGAWAGGRPAAPTPLPPVSDKFCPSTAASSLGESLGLAGLGGGESLLAGGRRAGKHDDHPLFVGQVHASPPSFSPQTFQMEGRHPAREPS